MNLHESPDVFQELIQRTAVTYSIPEAYVEKDYWVTMTLRRLCDSEFADDIVFKGGTALSKAHGIIERFSEDIDLAAKDTNLTQSATRQLLKGASEAATVDLTYRPNHALESKHGTFRKTVHAYPTQRPSDDFGQVSNHILLEINAFAAPEPYQPLPISSMILRLLVQEGHDGLVDDFGLHPFSINVISVERTLCEKIMGLVKASCQEDPIAELRRQIRHVYDVCMILRQEQYKAFVASDEFLALIQTVRETDAQQFKNADQWLTPPAHQTFFFNDPAQSWAALSAEFQGSFREMVFHDQLPDEGDVTGACELLRRRLEAL